MTILVGYPLKRRAKAVLSLAGMLARTSGEDLMVCVVIPAPWMPGLSRADQGYRAYIDELVDTDLLVSPPEVVVASGPDRLGRAGARMVIERLDGFAGAARRIVLTPLYLEQGQLYVPAPVEEAPSAQVAR